MHATAIEADELTDDQITNITQFFAQLGHAEKRLLKDLAKTDVRHIPLSEYPPSRVATILAEAKEKQEYCQAMREEVGDQQPKSRTIFLSRRRLSDARRERETDEGRDAEVRVPSRLRVHTLRDRRDQ